MLSLQHVHFLLNVGPTGLHGTLHISGYLKVSSWVNSIISLLILLLLLLSLLLLLFLFLFLLLLLLQLLPDFHLLVADGKSDKDPIALIFPSVRAKSQTRISGKDQ